MNDARLVRNGAVTALAGFILSGPVGFLTVILLKPQPEWTSPAVFVANYHWIQNLPYYFGFLLVGGMAMVAAGHYLNSAQSDTRVRFALLLSVLSTSVFAALITFNYICQTTYIHNLAVQYSPANDIGIAMFSMVNPTSLCWAIEMWGYAILGIATLLLAAYYRKR